MSGLYTKNECSAGTEKLTVLAHQKEITIVPDKIKLIYDFRNDT